MTGGWTEERQATLTRLVHAGKSAGEISKVLGVSRSAIIGRVHRSTDLHLTGRSVKTTVALGTAKGIPSTKPKKAAPVHPGNLRGKREGRSGDPVFHQPITTAEAYAFDAASRALPIGKLRLRGDCKFPVNEAAPGEPHLFCGLPTMRGSWCDHHRRRVAGAGTRGEQAASEEPRGRR
ncbi:GcrA family cell cycle regulator [Aliihoeflea sp. 40Bstr573]|uniref:GcrA family cell cycle regulator n=1 Tax=Aliihoeflea sp. 40Bstr573 TaxID=2696467 RepID=UPI0020953B2A|nr:GcrA family cell cycle regulator [Aliihoeflea sp. 40Bstr573]MCO6386372.1 hypothetical protein [Aliihoeflea sp. 40Bstr573]